MLQSLFLFLTIAGVPIAIAMSGASLIYVIATGNLPVYSGSLASVATRGAGSATPIKCPSVTLLPNSG